MVTEVKRHLRERIRDEELGPGDVIPAIKVLSERHGRRDGVVRKAIRELMEEGVIDRKSGCFVVAADGPHHAEVERDRYALSCSVAAHQSAVRRLRQKVKKAGHRLTVYHVDEYNRHPELERELLLKLRRRNYRGVGLLPSPIPPRNTDLFHELRSQGMKVALLGPHKYDVSEEPVFLPNDRLGGYRLVSELARRGFSRLVFVGRRKWAVYKDWIVDGARKAAEDRDVQIREITEDLEAGGEKPLIEDMPADEWMMSVDAVTAVVTFHGRNGSIMENIRRDIRHHHPDRQLGAVCCFGDPPQGYEDLPRIRYNEALQLRYAVEYLLDDDIPPDKLVQEWLDPIFVPGYLDA